METRFVTYALILLFFFPLLAAPCISSAFNDEGPGDVDKWCTETPHPAACSNSLPRAALDRSEFYELSVRAAHHRAIRALSHLRRASHPLSLAAQTSHAWTDCIKLYANAVRQLNRTLASSEHSFYDSQTWLSAALTNLDMCRTGFVAVGAPLELIAPVESYNVSDLISNCLAINGATGTAYASAKRASGKYPEWVRAGVRGRRLGETAATADVVVAKDGSGRFTSINKAVAAVAAMKGRTGRVVVFVKRGVYKENVQIPSSVEDLTLVGEGMGRTVITGSRGVADGYTLITCATLAVFGDGFIARDLTIQNAYGLGSQAVALLLASDRSVIHRCRIDGYQDSLLTFSQRQFYRECQVLGTVDFIFGNAAAVLQNCTILPRRPLKGQSDPITAQGRSDPNQNTGIVIHRSVVRPFTDLVPVQDSVKAFLGRPWKEYSRTIYMQNYLSGVVDPKGWLEWDGNFALSTLYYAEFQNTGPGSRLSRRVNWPGYHIIVKPSLVKKFTVGEFIAGGMWLPATGTPFVAGF